MPKMTKDQKQILDDLLAVQAVLDQLEFSSEGSIKRYPDEQDVQAADTKLRSVIATLKGEKK